MIRQLLSFSTSEFNVMVEWFVILHRFVIGVGASCSMIADMFSEKEDANEERDIVIEIVSLFWIFNFVCVVKETETLKAYSIGFGLKPLTPLIMIGVVK